MGYILYLQTPGLMYSTTQRWGCEYRRNVDSPSRVFFWKGSPPPPTTSNFIRVILNTDLFKIHHSAFQTVLLKINFQVCYLSSVSFRNYDKLFKFKAILKIGNLNIQISYTKNITFLENCRHYKEDLITPYQDRFHTSLLH